MPPDKNFLGFRLIALRASAGLSQAALGKLVGLSVNAVAHLEHGRQKPSYETFLALADALGASLDYLAGIDPAQNHIPPWLMPRRHLIAVMPPTGQAAVNAVIDALATGGRAYQDLIDMYAAVNSEDDQPGWPKEGS